MPLALALVPASPKERHKGELGRWSTCQHTLSLAQLNGNSMKIFRKRHIIYRKRPDPPCVLASSILAQL